MKQLITALFFACSLGAIDATAQERVRGNGENVARATNERPAAQRPATQRPATQRPATQRIEAARRAAEQRRVEAARRAAQQEAAPAERRVAPARPVLIRDARRPHAPTRGTSLLDGRGGHPVVLSGTIAERLRRSLADGRTRGKVINLRRSGAEGSIRTTGGDAAGR